MNKNLYSNTEFTELKKRLNQEILRRGTFSWWDPLTLPSIGQDKTPSLSLPDEGIRIPITEKTYTINNPSEGSIERTRNIHHPAQGENPAGVVPNIFGDETFTSAAQVNVDEMRNFLVGLSKIQDINLFYGRDEIKNLAFRDPNGIEEALSNAEKSLLNKPLIETDLNPSKNDPNGGMTDRENPIFPNANHIVTYPIENGQYVMPSGERNGEEILQYEGLGPNNFFDDYGAKPGDSDYHPYNRHISAQVRRDQNNQGNNRDENKTVVIEGGVRSSSFGQNPRNPNPGSSYRSRVVMGGVKGACNVACTGLCHVTCDNECSESCTTTCWNRCGEACTATCGNICTGCSTLCYTSCKTKCENITGYSCLKAGAKTVKITSTGGRDGIPAKNTISIETYSCIGCSYSCQFYPNKKTECWDSGCMGKCFTSCNTACSTSCFGGCIDNAAEDSDTFGYKSGKGRGCSSGCTLNCIGNCEGVCEGYCIQTCWHGCKQTCSDNCAYTCATNCGSGCFEGCNSGCTGCSSCVNSCTASTDSRVCTGCSIEGGCTSMCQHDCNANCIGIGCRSVCGIDAGGACEANCRLSCMGTSCTAMCEDACSGRCSTCVNTCGWQCGSCSSLCSTGCESSCNINCTETCKQNCTENCVHSCSEECGGCSNLCYSCIGMCIGVCSVKCSNACSNCANNCGWWCDSSCNQQCFGNCDSFCINTCTGSCITYLTSNTTMTKGPDRGPISYGYLYPEPKNRKEERESFKIVRPIKPYPSFEDPEEEIPKILITFDDDRTFIVIKQVDIEHDVKQSSINSGVYDFNHTTGEVTINTNMIPGLVSVNEPNLDGGDGLFIVILYHNPEVQINNNDIAVKLPFGFIPLKPIWDENNNIIIIIARDKFLIPEKEDN